MINKLFLNNGPYYTMRCVLWTSHFVAHNTEVHAIIFLKKMLKIHSVSLSH